ncbi:MAG TPA: FtsL-like putative cell division protein [Bacteroidales bacterium]|nr:FtsL-like putative cell division protein [Bacteroidales bacterium]
MSEEKEKKNIEFVSEKEEVKEIQKYSVKHWITGRVFASAEIRSQLPFIVFLAFLGFVYIANRYHAERLMRNTLKLKQELDELRAESITTASELMFLSRQSQVQKFVNQENLGLKEAVAPPKRIKWRD